MIIVRMPPLVAKKKSQVNSRRITLGETFAVWKKTHGFPLQKMIVWPGYSAFVVTYRSVIIQKICMIIYI